MRFWTLQELNIGFFSVTNLTLLFNGDLQNCMVITSIESDIFIPVSMTLIKFWGQSSVRELNMTAVFSQVILSSRVQTLHDSMDLIWNTADTHTHTHTHTHTQKVLNWSVNDRLIVER